MKRIGVLGANGQVGAEVCVYLTRMPGVQVIPICRSRLAAAFLTRCGLESRIGALNSPEQASELLAGCDVVADLTLPRGSASEIRQRIRTGVTNAVQYSPSGAHYVYFSSEMAFGMASTERFIKARLLSRTIYGATKRFGERLAFRSARAAGKQAYALRLGQVHGEIQAVSREFVEAVRRPVLQVPDAITDSVFTFSVAEALVNIAHGKERPGLYTLVSVPQWTWKELYEYYARRLAVDCRIETYPLERPGNPLRQVWQQGLQALFRMCIDKRETASAYLLHRMPDVERRLTAIYRCRQAATQIRNLTGHDTYRPCRSLLGDIPGARLRSLSDSRTTMPPLADEIRQLINTACEPSRAIITEAASAT